MSKKIEEKIIPQFLNLIEIGNSHRGIAVREELQKLKHQIETTQIPSSLMPVIKLYVFLSNYGGTKPLGKKKRYEGRYYAKVWLASPIMQALADGQYNNNHGVRILQSKGDIFSVVLHEIHHYITNEIYESGIPEPRTAWN